MLSFNGSNEGFRQVNSSSTRQKSWRERYKTHARLSIGNVSSGSRTMMEIRDIGLPHYPTITTSPVWFSLDTIPFIRKQLQTLGVCSFMTFGRNWVGWCWIMIPKGDFSVLLRLWMSCNFLPNDMSASHLWSSSRLNDA